MLFVFINIQYKMEEGSFWLRSLYCVHWLGLLKLLRIVCVWWCHSTVRLPTFTAYSPLKHDDVIKGKHFPRYWLFVRGIHWWPVNSPHKGQWRWAVMFSLICLNKRLNKHSGNWWFETPSHILWRHCNESLFCDVCGQLLESSFVIGIHTIHWS